MARIANPPPPAMGRVKGRPRSGRTFRELQARNRRRAFVLAVGMIILLGGVGVALGATWGSWLVGLLVGSGFALVQYLVARSAGSKMVLAVAGARPVERRQDPQLVNVVEEIAVAAGMPCPTVYLIDDPSPNAFATGFKPEKAAVAITTGLRDKLNRDELQAVIAHEIGHIRNGDSGYMVLMAVLVGSIAMLCDAAMRGMIYGRRARATGRGKGHGVVLLIALVLAILAPIFSKILQAAVSRQREYLADATSVELTRHPKSLVAALRKLTNDPTPLQASNRATQHLYIVNPMRRARGGGGMLSTHPPLQERIRRIEDLYV